jgi:hypothetical protein
MKIQGKALLKPGIYIVAANDFQVNSGAEVSIKNDPLGTLSSLTDGRPPYPTPGGVTIILTNKPGGVSFAKLQINGGARINLVAPTSGPWAGILFYQDRNAPVSISSSDTNLVNGDSGSSYQGVMYFPSRSVNLTGDATFPTGCLQIISQTVTFNGNVTLTNTCTDPSFKKISGVQVSLVE